MTTALLLRRDPAAAHQMQSLIDATRDLRVVGIATTLADAQRQVAARVPDVLLTDLSLSDGPAIALLTQLRRQAVTRERPKVMLITRASSDALLFGSICAGADSYYVDAPGGLSVRGATRALTQGEAAMGPALALQVLGFFGVAYRAGSLLNERALDWQRGADDPLQLSRGEQHMLALFAQGEPVGRVAMRLAFSIESVGRRLSNVYRKLQWDLRSGTLALQAG